MQIHRISTHFSESYIIEIDRELVLVDAGMPGSEHQILQRINQFNHSDLKIILITHAHVDHYGSAAALRNITGAKIAVHSADAEAMAKGKSHLGKARGRGKIVSSLFPLLEKIYQLTPTKADIYFENGDELQINRIGCKVIHTPGHTPGSCTYLIKDKFAFVGDLISNNGKPHIQKYFAQDWRLIPLSIQTIKSMRPGWTYTGHGKKPIKLSELQRL